MTEKLFDTLISDKFNGRPVPEMSNELWDALIFIDDF